jgi:hypothetical protein
MMSGASSRTSYCLKTARVFNYEATLNGDRAFSKVGKGGAIA